MNRAADHWPNDHFPPQNAVAGVVARDCAAGGSQRNASRRGGCRDRCHAASPSPILESSVAGHGSTMQGWGRAVACALALAVAMPTTAGAFEPAPTTSSSPATKVDLDLSGLEPIDPSVRADLAKRIHTAAEPVVKEHALAPDRIHLAVLWMNADNFDYKVELSFDAVDGVPARQHTIYTGKDTEEGELAEAIAANLERYLGEWQVEYDREQKRLRAQALTEPTTTTTTRDEPPPKDLQKERKLGKVGWTGVGLAIAGAGAMATGGALAGIRTTPDPDDATQLRDWRPAGYGLLATGGALLITGVILVAVDATTRARGRRAAVAPVLGPRTAGVQLRMRF